MGSRYNKLSVQLPPHDENSATSNDLDRQLLQCRNGYCRLWTTAMKKTRPGANIFSRLSLRISKGKEPSAVALPLRSHLLEPQPPIKTSYLFTQIIKKITIYSLATISIMIGLQELPWSSNGVNKIVDELLNI